MELNYTITPKVTIKDGDSGLVQVVVDVKVGVDIHRSQLNERDSAASHARDLGEVVSAKVTEELEKAFSERACT